MLILRKPWDSQPQETAALASRFSFNAALTPVDATSLQNLVAGTGWRTLAGGLWTPSGVSYMESSVCSVGRSIKTTNAAVPHFYRSNPVTSGPRTVVIVFVPSGTAATSGIWSIGNTGSSGAPSFLIQQNGADARLYAGGAYAATLTGVCAANKPICLVASISNVTNAASAKVVLAVNGVVASATVTVSGESANEYLCSGYNAVALGHYAAMFGVNSFFDAGPAASISVDPWQLFEPRRIFVPVSAGAATVPSLSLPTVANITTTGARLGLTLA